MPIENPIPRDLKKLLAFGSGVGLEIGDTGLEAVIARVRPTRVDVIGRMTIPQYATRPAAEWGAEYTRFLKAAGAHRLSATVLLPRKETIVRQISLPGVASRDIEGAVRFQLDSLHPYGEDEVVWGWSPVGYGSVLVGIVLRSTLDRYVALFSEAGIAARSFTFAAAVMHVAVRLNAAPPKEGFVALSRSADGRVDVYGESPSRPAFSADFDLAPRRAAMVALSELRLAPETEPRALEDMLPAPRLNPVENDLARNPRPYATAICGACPQFKAAANLLPPNLRRTNSRAVFIPTIVLAALLLLVAGSMAGYAAWSDRQYHRQIADEIARLEPLSRRAGTLDEETRRARARALMLDQFRKQTRHDLDSLNELTHVLTPPTWTQSMTLGRDSVRINGETRQTALLVKLLDSSPLFEKTEIQGSGARQDGESFQIRTNRRKVQ
jgi:hypothetical protein